jgi:hypothetical protein
MDDWTGNEMEPDSGDYETGLFETFKDGAVLFLKVIGFIVFVIAVIALFAYDIWREIAIFDLLTSK